MKDSLIHDVLRSLLICLFVYTAAVKLINLSSFRITLELQPFGRNWISVLVWAIPSVEMLTGILLLFKKTSRIGFIASFLILLAFTIYSGLVVSGYYSHQPCACGGILSDMTWTEHFVFNICFIMITITAMFLQRDRKVKHHINVLQSGVAEYL